MGSCFHPVTLMHQFAAGAVLWMASLGPVVPGLAVPSPAAPDAAHAKKYNIVFQCSCDDQISQGYALAFRNLLASSGRYTELDDTAENRKHSLVVRSVSMSMSEDRDRQVAVAGFATVLTASDAYLDLYVQKCGRYKPGDCARTIFHQLDDIVTRSEALHS